MNKLCCRVFFFTHGRRKDVTTPGNRPDDLPIVIPKYIGDIRVANGKVTVYKQ